MDTTAKVGGLLTAVISWVSGWFAPVEALRPMIIISPVEADAIVRILVAVIGAVGAIICTALAVFLKYLLENRKKKSPVDSQ